MDNFGAIGKMAEYPILLVVASILFLVCAWGIGKKEGKLYKIFSKSIVVYIPLLWVGVFYLRGL